MLGLTARVGAPGSVLDLDSRHFIAFLEGLIRENEQMEKQLDEIYVECKPAPPAPQQSPEERRAEIQRAMRLFGG